MWTDIYIHIAPFFKAIPSTHTSGIFDPLHVQIAFRFDGNFCKACEQRGITLQRNKKIKIHMELMTS